MRRKLFYFFRATRPPVRFALNWLVVAGLTVPLLAGCVRPDGAVCSGTRCSQYPVWGEYGGNLNLLRCFYTPPQSSGESNYFIDMQGDEPLRNFALAHGLTNNHALFVLCHGRAIDTPSGSRYGFVAGKNE